VVASLRGVLKLSALLQEVTQAAGSATSMPPGMVERIFDKVNAAWELRRSLNLGGSVHWLSQQIADSLQVEHISFHFRVSDRRLIAPREMCHNYRLPFDLVTDLGSSGLTSHMARNPGVYNLSGPAIKAHARARSGPRPSRFTPVYNQECNSLLSMPFYVEGRPGGLIKLENRRSLTADRSSLRDSPFTDSEVEQLRQTLEAASPTLTRAYHWVCDHHPDPQVYISQDFDKPAA
jgi:hypothetical protein